MAPTRIHISRQATLLVLAGALHTTSAGPGDTVDKPPLPRLPDGDEKEFNKYSGELVDLSRKVLSQVKTINDEYMQKLHLAMCAKQQAFYTAGLEHQVPVCQRMPPGFDKNLDCPAYTNPLGKAERRVLSSHCSDLLEEEYFVNLTMTYEKNLKELQKDRLDKMNEESDAVKAEFATHLQQVNKAGARALLEESPADKPAAKGKQAFGGAAWSEREREAWRAEVHSEAEDYAAAMTKIVSELQRFRKSTLLKVSADLNRTVNRAKTVNRIELEKHKEPWDCWAKLNTDVFDFTPWIQTHPGGSRLIADKCGTDVTNTWNHFHAAVGTLPGERRVGLWDANDELGTTTAAPCEHEFSKEAAGGTVQTQDGHIAETASGKVEDVPVSLADKQERAGAAAARARAPVQQASLEESASSPEMLPVDPRMADESPSSPLTVEAFQARRAALLETAESASSPLPLMRRVQ